MSTRLDASHPDFIAQLRRLLDSRRREEASVGDTVAAILRDVQARGDAALIEYTARFDRLTLAADALRVTEAEIAQAERECAAEVVAALTLAAERIRAFHAKQSPHDLDYTDALGVRLGLRWSPVRAVGMYVPGGKASYPSSVLMNAIPAKVAGVQRLVMVVPTPDWVVNPAILVAAKLAGVDEIYRIGGAQAVAALAYGTETIAPVKMIVGPGNAYVAEAKRQVFGRVGIDMIAGPSEILVVADRTANPRWIAADLLSQAEHDAEAQSILLTDDAALADAVAAEVETILETLPRRDIAAASWRDYGSIIITPRLDEAAMAIANTIAAEHVELCVSDPESLLPHLTEAGAIFLGHHTPEALGDYVAGPSHVLPTMQTASFSSGLSVYSFLKKSSLIGCPPEAFAALAEPTRILAENEGLGAHALSVHAAHASMSDTDRISTLELKEGPVLRRKPEVEQERRAAIDDLLRENAFAPVGLGPGPYRLSLGISENRLLFSITSAEGGTPVMVTLAVTPFRTIIRDYFMICESYFQAVKTGDPHKIEAIDMGRRGIHNEGADMLRKLLAEKIAVDFATARRLFTLICVLHIR